MEISKIKTTKILKFDTFPAQKLPLIALASNIEKQSVS